MRTTNSPPKIRQHLLWEFDQTRFDFSQSANVVIERVIERGTFEEWREIIRFYGKAKIRAVAEQSRQLDLKHKNFTTIYLDSAYNVF